MANWLGDLLLPLVIIMVILLLHSQAKDEEKAKWTCGLHTSSNKGPGNVQFVGI